MPFRIFVVDDDHDTADSLVMVLKIWGFGDSQAFYSAHEALQAAIACCPSVMLVDIAMPKMDGFRLAKSIRDNQELKDMLLVAVSGYADPEHRLLAMQAGYDRFFAKPADFAELEELLKRAREKRSGG
jgi:CheY-like chemotaxis protein